MTPRYFHHVANGHRFDGFGMLAAADPPMNATTARGWIREQARIGADGFGKLAAADPLMNGTNVRGWIRERERELEPALSELHIWVLRLGRVGELQLSRDKGYYAERECKRDGEF